MLIYNLTRYLDNGIYYKQRARLNIDSARNGEIVESSMKCSSMHIGTHMDLPLHFSGDSYKGEEAFVFSTEQVLFVKSTNLSQCVESKSVEIVIIDFEEEESRFEAWYPYKFSALNLEILDHILSCYPNLKIIGTNNPSIGDPQNSSVNKSVHKKLLLDNNILVLEDVTLPSHIPNFETLVISMIPIESAESRFCSVLLLCRN